MQTGQSAPYIDARERVTGRIGYVINMSRPEMLHAAVLRSPYPHARITKIDPRPALEVPGVVVVLTREDIVDNPEVQPCFGPVIEDQPVVAIDKVRFIGDPVAAVAAVDRETAQHAANLIDVEYEELPAVFNIEEALSADAPLIHEATGRRQHRLPEVIPDTSDTNYCNHFVLRKGDVEAGFAEADLVFEDRFTTPTAQHVPLEPHAAVAEIGPDGSLTVWSSTQDPHFTRTQLAELFNLPESRVRVIVPTLGGGYGAKTYLKIEPMAAVLAWKTGQAVKLVLDRDEEFLTITKHASIVRVKTGVKEDGTLVARACELWWDAGAYADISPRLIRAGGYTAIGPYRVPHVKIDSHAVYTNKPLAGAFRGFGVAQVAWACESQMDMMAERLGLDSIEFRMKNLLEPGDSFSTGETMHDVHFKQLLGEAAEAIAWGEDNGQAVSVQRCQGKGVGISLKSTITPSTSTGMVKVNGDGSISVLSSTVEIGQGARTVLVQMVCEAMTVPLEQVTVVDPDTDVTPYDLTTASSRSTYSMGGALRGAAEDAKQQLIELATDLLEAHADDLEVRDGGVYVRGSGQGLSYGEIVGQSRCGNVVGRGIHQTEGGLDPETGQGIASVHWHQAAAAAEVEVDMGTGAVEVTRLHANTYTGKTVNPTSAALQVEGCMTFGLGKALLEEMIFDQGQLTNASLADYMIPSLLDVPESLSTSLVESSDPEADMHGVGETALPPVAPAVGNAIYNAIGVRIPDLPITPEKVLKALREKQ